MNEILKILFVIASMVFVTWLKWPRRKASRVTGKRDRRYLAFAILMSVTYQTTVLV